VNVWLLALGIWLAFDVFVVVGWVAIAERARLRAARRRRRRGGVLGEARAGEYRQGRARW
jgi:hypothetical protein